MAKLIRSNFLCALAEGQPVFSAGTGRFTISITGQEGIAYPHRGRSPAVRGLR